MILLGFLIGAIVGAIFFWSSRESGDEPELKKIRIIVPLVFIIIFTLAGAGIDIFHGMKSQEYICIESIEEYTQTSWTGTKYLAFINDEYEIQFRRPHQFGVGDCFEYIEFMGDRWVEK